MENKNKIIASFMTLISITSVLLVVYNINDNDVSSSYMYGHIYDDDIYNYVSSGSGEYNDPYIIDGQTISKCNLYDIDNLIIRNCNIVSFSFSLLSCDNLTIYDCTQNIES
jgi:hypothetical protein